MCPPPCGPRRNHRGSSRKPAVKIRITKKAVRELIMSGNYECTCRLINETEFREYEGCQNNLLLMLKSPRSKVAKAGRANEHFQELKHTIIMEVEGFATVIFRTDI